MSDKDEAQEQSETKDEITIQATQVSEYQTVQRYVALKWFLEKMSPLRFEQRNSQHIMYVYPPLAAELKCGLLPSNILDEAEEILEEEEYFKMKILRYLPGPSGEIEEMEKDVKLRKCRFYNVLPYLVVADCFDNIRSHPLYQIKP